MSQYSCILFDWDGCLANTLPIWLEGYHQTFAAFGLHPSDAEITSKAFGDWQAAAKFGIQDNDRFIQLLTSYVDAYFENAPLTPGAKQMLAAVKLSGLATALVSSSKRIQISQALGYHHLEPSFNIVITKEDVTHHKPDPEMINKAIILLETDRQQTLIVGDSSSDIIAGHRAGIATCLYRPLTNERIYTYEFVRDYPPTFTIKSWDEFLLTLGELDAVEDGDHQDSPD